MKKNEMIINIVHSVMLEKGFELETDKRTYWRWKKMVADVKEEVVLLDMQQIVRLTIGKMIHGVTFTLGDELLYTIDIPRTHSEDWFYCNCAKEQRKERYENILYDIRDILVKNCDRILEAHAEKVKKAIPNRKHFEKLRDNYEELVEEYSQKYVTGNKNILEILDIIMYQISLRFGKELDEVEDDLVGFAALMYFETQKQYGGTIKINEEQESMMLLEIGKTKSSFNFLSNMFHIWEDMSWFNEYRKKVIRWYANENS